MEEDEILLDTPKKASLQQQSKSLRGALKEFERKFATENGRKARQADIKLDADIAAKYKDYHKIQEVLAGRLAFEQYQSTHSTDKLRIRKHTRTDSGVGSSPHKQTHAVYATPRKNRHSRVADSSAQELKLPDVCFLNTIGPTPHRDGKIVGLFDLMSNSGSVEEAVTTPSSSTRKRKIEELYENTPAKRHPLQTIQTPSHKSPSKKKGDLLDFLTGTPQKCPGSSIEKYSRTPQSEGRKFELSQFFATPSAQRFLFSSSKSIRKDEVTSPIRDVVRGIDCTPQQPLDTKELDLTPAYLRRSTSFKDRLISASQVSTTCKTEPCMKRTGPPTLQHFRSSTSNILKATEVQYIEPMTEMDDFDDDLEALRDLEDDAQPSNLLVKDSQLNVGLTFESDDDGDQPARKYKKKGQKRTTRKANIKPVALKPTLQPKFVAPDGFQSDEEDGEAWTETNRANGSRYVDAEFTECNEKGSGGTTKKHKVARSSGKEGTNDKNKKRAGMINPNAQSHTNYRSLKIKSKNSKATGAGRNRFGRGRR